MQHSVFYDVGLLDQLAINLFYGCGYNFYRVENQLRADDQKVRAQACASLGAARARIEQQEAAYRRQFLPPPTRAKPLPDPEAIAGAQALERLSTAIGLLEGSIRSAPVPANDRITQRYRQEAQTLVQLGMCDQRLVGQAERLRQYLGDKDYTAILADEAGLGDALAMMMQSVQERQRLLI